MPTDTELIADVQQEAEQEKPAETETAEEISPEKKKKRRFPLSIQTCICLGLILGAVIVQIIAVNSTAFSDWYRSHIFPLWVATYGRLTSLFSFSFGEILIMIAVFCTVIITALFKVRQRVLGWQKGLIKW